MRPLWRDLILQKQTVAKIVLTRRRGFVQSQGTEVHMIHPERAVSRWKSMLSTFFGVVFPHSSLTPPTPFPRLQPSPRLRPTSRSGHRLLQRPSRQKQKAISLAIHV
jgi:hypothetical protein